MLTCQLEELPVNGVMWTIIVFGFIVVGCLIAMIYVRTSKK